MLTKILSPGSRLVTMPGVPGAVLLPLLASMLLSHALNRLLDE